MSKHISESSSIYNYQLIERIILHRLRMAIHLSSLLGFALILVWYNGFVALLTILLGSVLIAIFHWAVACALIPVFSKEKTRGWTFLYYPLWIGYLPKEHIRIRRFSLVQLHTFGFGLSVIGCLYPWITTTTLIALCFIHCWLIVPRLWIIFRLYRKHSQGLLKLNPSNVSYYKS